MEDNNVPSAQASPVSPSTSGIAIASLVCGILGFVTMGFAGIPAIILGHVGLSKIRKSGGNLGGRGIAIGGLVTGYLSALLVVGLVGAIYTLKGVAASAKTKQSEADMHSFQSALDAYKIYAGTYPTSQQGLEALIEKPTATPVPDRWVQIMSKVPLDPWAHQYAYKFPGSKSPKKPEITSSGPDGIAGSEDDVSGQWD